MDATSPDARPPRRPRYRGTHPRRFSEKYKELDPARDPATVAKVLASGKTPAGSHVPVLVAGVLAALRPAAGETGVDATLGHGGHAAELLARILPGGRLAGLDVDPLELPRATARLAAMGFGEPEFMPVRCNYAGLPKAMAGLGLAAVDFVLADLGCSSMQLDDPGRGFTFKADGPLDMRMNPARGLSAGRWLERATRDELARALADNADEPQAEELAAALAGRAFASTRELARAVRAALGAGVADDEAEPVVRRVFQALRIAVNDEFGALDAFLRVLPGCLAPGGRAALISFHSGEDRRVKRAFREGLAAGIWAEISDHVVTADADERRANPRAAAAKLRWAVRAGHSAADQGQGS
jgi:16S rRNA (cytosine1402-N4)-methyltransferase